MLKSCAQNLSSGDMQYSAKHLLHETMNLKINTELLLCPVPLIRKCPHSTQWNLLLQLSSFASSIPCELLLDEMQNRIYFKLAPSPHASQLPITFKLKCTWNFNFKMHAKVKIAYFFPDCSTTVTKVIHYAWNWNQLLENRWIIVNPMLFHLKPLLEYFCLFKLWEY